MSENEIIKSVIDVIKKSHLTKAEISRQTGISAKQIERWVSGETTNIRQSSANKILNKLSGTTTVKEEVAKMQHNTYADELIEAQREIIKQRDSQINEITTRLKTRHASKVKPACDFRIITELYTDDDLSYDDAWQDKKLIRGDMKVNGNTSVWGYTIEEVEKMSIEDFAMAYHPESLKEAIKMKNLLRDTDNDMVHFRGLRTIKHKKGHWVNFMVEYIFERNPAKGNNAWDAVSYFQLLNGGGES